MTLVTFRLLILFFIFFLQIWSVCFCRNTIQVVNAFKRRDPEEDPLNKIDTLPSSFRFGCSCLVVCLFVCLHIISIYPIYIIHIHIQQQVFFYVAIHQCWYQYCKIFWPSLYFPGKSVCFQLAVRQTRCSTKNPH